MKMSIKKFSILGVVLTAASAVTAAFVPAQKESARFADGVLIESATNGGVGIYEKMTCKPSGGSVQCVNTLTGQGSGNTNVGSGTQSDATTA